MPDTPIPETSPSTLASILITPVLHVLRQSNETMERRMQDVQAHLVEIVTLRQEHMLAKLLETDLRYQQRFQAQSEALTAAFAAQQAAMEKAFIAAEKAVMAALAAADRAVTKAETANEKRFESVNEFRAVLTEQSKELLTRFEAETANRAITEKLDQQAVLFHTTTASLEKRLNMIEGGQVGQSQSWGVIAGIVGVVIGIAGVTIALLKLMQG